MPKFDLSGFPRVEPSSWGEEEDILPSEDDLVARLLPLLARSVTIGREMFGKRLPKVSRTVDAWGPAEGNRMTGVLLEETNIDWAMIRPVIEAVRESPEWSEAAFAVQQYVDENQIAPVGFVHGNVSEVYLAPLVTRYLETHSELRQDGRGARAAALELLNHLRAPAVNANGLLVLDGFSAERPFRLDAQLEVRPIKTSELFSLAPSNQVPLLLQSTVTTLKTHWWVCHARVSNHRGSMDGINQIAPLMNRVEKVLRLFKSGGIRCWNAATTMSGPFASAGRMFSQPPPMFGQFPGRYTLTRTEARQLTRLWRDAAPVLTPEHHYLQLSINRLQMATSRSRADDRIVDCMIGLESLLGLASERDALGYRIRVRGAVVLGKSAEDRRNHLGKLREMYELRSRIVHGSLVSPADLSATAEYGEEALRSVWRWFFREHGTATSNEEGVRHIDELLVTRVR